MIAHTILSVILSLTLSSILLMLKDMKSLCKTKFNIWSHVYRFESNLVRNVCNEIFATLLIDV